MKKIKYSIVYYVLIIIVTSLFVLSAQPFDGNQAWHPIQQITTDETGTTSVDILPAGSPNGIIDRADQLRDTVIVTDPDRVGIGTTNPKNILSIYKSIIGKDASVAESHIYLRGSDNGYGLSLGVLNNPASTFLQARVNDADPSIPILLNPEGGNVGIGTTSPQEKLHVNGNVQATTYFHNSDIRLKDDIQEIDDAIEIIKRLNGVRFRWIDSQRKDMGFIAQDVETILPEIVKTDSEGYKSIEYSNMVAVLVQAIKEQQKQIDSLKQCNK